MILLTRLPVRTVASHVDKPMDDCTNRIIGPSRVNMGRELNGIHPPDVRVGEVHRGRIQLAWSPDYMKRRTISRDETPEAPGGISSTANRIELSRRQARHNSEVCVHLTSVCLGIWVRCGENVRPSQICPELRIDRIQYCRLTAFRLGWVIWGNTKSTN